LLGLVVAVEKERAVAGSPAVLVRDTPDGDADALGDLEAGVHDGEVVVGRGARDVELGDGDLLNVGGGKSFQGSGDTRGRVPAARGSKMGLRADAVDGNALGEPLVHVGDHAVGELGVVGNVKVVVVDVKLGVGVRGAGGAEGDAYEVLAEHAAEDAVAEVTILSEDLVNNVPLEDLSLVVGDGLRDVVLDDLG